MQSHTREDLSRNRVLVDVLARLASPQLQSSTRCVSFKREVGSQAIRDRTHLAYHALYSSHSSTSTSPLRGRRSGAQNPECDALMYGRGRGARNPMAQVRATVGVKPT